MNPLINKEVNIFYDSDRLRIPGGKLPTVETGILKDITKTFVIFIKKEKETWIPTHRIIKIERRQSKQ